MQTSRQQFTDYQEEIRRRQDERARTNEEAKSKAPTKSRSSRELFVAFLALLRGHRSAIAFALASLSVATLLKLVPPFGVKLTIDYVLTDQTEMPAAWQTWGLPTDRFQLLLLISAVVIGSSIVASIVHLWGRWFATKTVNRVQVALRKATFEHGVHLPLHRIFELKSGGAASLLREDTGGAAELVFSMLYNPWRAIVQLLGSLVVLVVVDWRIMIGGLAMLPIVYVTHRTWIRRIRPLWRDVRRQRQHIDAGVTETFGGMRIVRAFARERTESGRFVRNNDLLIRQQLFVWLRTRLIEFTWDIVIPLASTTLMLYGGYRILQGSMTLGDLTMFLFYLAMLLEPLATLVSSAATFQNNLAGLERVLDVLDEPSEMPASPTDVSLSRAEFIGRVTFHDVGFRYPNSERRVLSGIDLDVQPGETIALVGRSGAGKTTMCNLVARFYDPTAGHISLDGRDLRDIRVDSYRRHIGIVEQDVFMFDGTIAENIGYGNHASVRADVISAAKAANAHEFIVDLDHGYDTVIGERGVKLSGGQRQRLAIARALLADPRILILDEATSNLDSESERLIQSSLRVLMEHRTCFVIAHRISTIGLADRIAVLEDGKLTAVAPHAELLAISASYRRMVDLQTISDPG